MSGLFNMGGCEAYVWSSYGVAAIVLVGLVVVSLRGLRAREDQLKSLEDGQKGEAS